MYDQDYIINTKEHKDLNFASLKGGFKKSNGIMDGGSIHNSPREKTGDYLILDKQQPHLSSFSVDRSKLDFFSKAQTIVSRMQRAQKNVLKLQTEKSSGLKEKSEVLREKAKQKRKEQALMHQAKIEEVLEKEEQWRQR